MNSMLSLNHGGKFPKSFVKDLRSLVNFTCTKKKLFLSNKTDVAGVEKLPIDHQDIRLCDRFDELELTGDLLDKMNEFLIFKAVKSHLLRNAEKHELASDIDITTAYKWRPDSKFNIPSTVKHQNGRWKSKAQWMCKTKILQGTTFPFKSGDLQIDLMNAFLSGAVNVSGTLPEPFVPTTFDYNIILPPQATYPIMSILDFDVQGIIQILKFACENTDSMFLNVFKEHFSAQSRSLTNYTLFTNKDHNGVLVRLADVFYTIDFYPLFELMFAQGILNAAVSVLSLSDPHIMDSLVTQGPYYSFGSLFVVPFSELFFHFSTLSPVTLNDRPIRTGDFLAKTKNFLRSHQTLQYEFGMYYSIEYDTHDLFLFIKDDR